MNKQNTDILCNKFPNLYNKDFYFECNDGWFDLIYNLSEKLNKLILEMPEAERKWSSAVQAKEKFGIMYFYISSGTDEMFNFISKAEKESARTCEVCGKPGKLTGEHWVETLCDKCSKIINNCKI